MFESDYTWLDPAIKGSWTLGPEFMYTIGYKAKDYHSAWGTFGDHTTGSGQMMIVNGTPTATEPKALVWGQTVTLPECDGYSEETSYPLYAGQNWEIGEVLVKTSADSVCVKFVITDPLPLDPDEFEGGWVITEVHVAIGDDLSYIPQKNGNPIPGKFPVNETIDPGVVETEWYCLPCDGEVGDTVYIAAHAVVELPEISYVEDTSFCIVSDTETLYKSGEDWPAAVPAWVHPSWTSNYGSPTPFGAAWIWNSYRVAEPVNGETVEFKRDFVVDGTPTEATLQITADNGYEALMNGAVVGSAQVYGEWKTSNLTQAFVDTNGWQSAETYSVSVNSGTNTLSIIGVNEYMGPLDGQADGTIDSNPGAVAYKLCVTASKIVVDREYDEETAWGGTEDFPGKNWATYISHEVQPPVCMYRLTFYTASSHYANPAALQVTINDEEAGVANLTATTGEWVEVTYDWDVADAATAPIESRDLNPIAWGDDFCIDDISLVKLP